MVSSASVVASTTSWCDGWVLVIVRTYPLALPVEPERRLVFRDLAQPPPGLDLAGAGVVCRMFHDGDDAGGEEPSGADGLSGPRHLDHFDVRAADVDLDPAAGARGDDVERA